MYSRRVCFGPSLRTIRSSAQSPNNGSIILMREPVLAHKSYGKPSDSFLAAGNKCIRSKPIATAKEPAT